ncbi:DUF86 domain-containing protein [Candidatus Sumerlaeota bacterium]|nr:DUF86 domain-containing protein [Candidatus Sumerlaeota bacterium]
MSRDEACLFDIFSAARRVAEGVEGIDYETFAADWKTHSAVQHQLTILGEAVKRLSPEFRQRHSHIPWRSIAGHRDVLIHQYDAVDLSEVWLIAKERIPELIGFLESQSFFGGP